MTHTMLDCQNDKEKLYCSDNDLRVRHIDYEWKILLEIMCHQHTI